MNALLRRGICAHFLRATFWVLIACSAADIRAAGYTFTNIADNTANATIGGFGGFGIPAISGNTVAFSGSFAGRSGVFTGSGGPLTTIVRSGDAAPAGTFGGFGDPTISGDAVAFRASYGVQQFGIFSGSGGPLTSIVQDGDAAPSGTFRDLGDPVISGNTAAFVATYAGGRGIFTGSGGPLTTIGAGIRPSISGDTVAFEVSDVGTYTGNGGATKFVGAGENPSISGDGVAYLGGDNGAGITLVRDGISTIIMRPFDPAPIGNILDWRAPATDGHSVAFFAFYGDYQLFTIEGMGIFAGSGGPLQAVIKTGDPLFGSTALSFVSPGFENWFGLDPGGTGNVAFGYELADGRRGIALAHPVPEPASLVLAVLAAALSFAGAVLSAVKTCGGVFRFPRSLTVAKSWEATLMFKNPFR